MGEVEVEDPKMVGGRWMTQKMRGMEMDDPKNGGVEMHGGRRC